MMRQYDLIERVKRYNPATSEALLNRAYVYAMMGDNRDNSTDSRVLSQVGYVPFENIVGRAQIIFFSILEGEHAWMVWRWPWAVRWNRLFTIVR